MKKKFIAILIALLLIGGGSAYYFLSYVPHTKAVNGFNTAVKTVQEKNTPLENKIDEAEKLVKSNKEPLDQKTLDNLQATIETSKSNLRKIPEMSDRTEEIKEQTEALNQPIDYSTTLTTLTDSITAYTNSVKQLAQITNPNQDFVEARLKEVTTITGVQSVTETNDPNGNLNKQGGYTASVYFTDSLVAEPVDGADIVEKGNDAGGNIEVYKTVDEAKARDTYLSAFDSQGFLNPGSHYVRGTLVIRTSRFLTASQQNELTENIYNKLIELKP